MNLSQLYHIIETMRPKQLTAQDKALISELKNKLAHFEQNPALHLPNSKARLICQFVETIPQKSRLNAVIPELYRGLYPHTRLKIELDSGTQTKPGL